MNLQGCCKLAASPSSVGKSFASLCSCLSLPGAAAAPSLRSVVSLSSVLDHVPIQGWRGFCWVRCTPPFSRIAAPKASLVQECPSTEIPAALEGKARLPFIEARHASFNIGTSASPTPALTGNASVGVHSVDVTAAPCLCEVNAAASDAFRRCLSDGNFNIVNGPGHPPGDVDSGVPLSADCLILQPCETTIIDGIGEAPQRLTSPSPSPGLVDSSVNFSSLSNATASKETSGLLLTKTKALKGPQLRRMRNSSHALVRDLKEEKMQWFPYLDQFKVKDQVLTSSQIMQMLGSFMLEERKDRIKRVVANRTYAVCIVVEGLLDLGNIAAIFRTADALGFQSVHVIANETDRRYKKNRKISLGSEKWLDAEIFNTTEDCFEELRSRGYRVAVASVMADSVPILDMDCTIPTAIVFGNEYRGVSREALEMADLSCHIPMEGMADSFNVSVAAGIVMHHAVNDRKTRLGRHGDLSEEEQRILSADFYLRHSSRSLSVIDRMLQKRQEEGGTGLQSVLMGDLEVYVQLPEYLKLDVENMCA